MAVARFLVSVSLLAMPMAALAGVTVLSAARIHTMDATQPRASAMAYDESGRVLALGMVDDLLRRYPQARRLEASDATVIPGLIDAHGHVAGLGLAKLRADLVGTRSKAEVLLRLQEFARRLPPGAWLQGRGWDQNDWPEKQFPSAADLDAAFPDRPVWLSRIDGHAGWANTAAMRFAKRDLSGDWQPDGGQIVRVGGKATGVFVDDAEALIDDAIPPLDEATAEMALRLGMQSAVEHGLTGVHDAGVSLGELRRYQRLADRGQLPLRIQAMADGDGAALQWLCEHGRRGAVGRLQRRSGQPRPDPAQAGGAGDDRRQG
jgi:hypothetical protein